LRSGEGEVIGDLDFALIDKRKAFMDATGHWSARIAQPTIDPRPARMSINGLGRTLATSRRAQFHSPIREPRYGGAV
jgi:hypothetical protein